MKKIVQDYPVLLLDDVLSELDSKRQNISVRHYPHPDPDHLYGLDEFVNSNFRMDKIFKL